MEQERLILETKTIQNMVTKGDRLLVSIALRCNGSKKLVVETIRKVSLPISIAHSRLAVLSAVINATSMKLGMYAL